MVARVDFDLSEWRDFQAQLKSLGTAGLDIAHQAAELTAATLDQKARETLPPPPRRLPQARLWTEKQRRWWWGTMSRAADGRGQPPWGWRARRDEAGRLQISGAYRRTGTLVKSLAWEARRDKSGTTIRYGTNRVYARYVIDEEQQAEYHRGNWPTLQALVNRHAPTLHRFFGEEVGRLLDEWFKKGTRGTP
jgi:hypothetical protein